MLYNTLYILALSAYRYQRAYLVNLDLNSIPKQPVQVLQITCYIYLQHSLTLAEAPLCPQDLRFSSIQGINYN